MGIISFIKGGVKELAIARPDEFKDQWVYKHPDQTIPMKAQLTVDSDEVALFFKDGKFVGSFSAGPPHARCLEHPVPRPADRQVHRRERLHLRGVLRHDARAASIKFGTSIGDVQDPQTQLRVRLMVHGEFSREGHRSRPSW